MKPARIDVGEELSSCPACAADRGFHVALRRKGRVLLVDLVCPSCGRRFVVGEWTVATGEPRPFDPAVDSGP